MDNANTANAKKKTDEIKQAFLSSGRVKNFSQIGLQAPV